jgi:hypothetical protein
VQQILDIATYYFFLGYEEKIEKERKKKLTDTGLLEIPWILDVKDFRTDSGLKRLI